MSKQNPFFPTARVKPQPSRPGRSAAFQAYLETQPPERQREIAAQEGEYLASRQECDAFGESPSERAFSEGQRGFEDRPAGGRHGGLTRE
jgi:hypothetical protein